MKGSEKLKYIGVCMFLVLNFQLFGQSLKFKLTSGDIHIGDLLMNKTINDTIITYNISSKVEVKIFVDNSIDYKLNSIYKNNILYYSSASVYVDDELYSSNIVEQIKGGYLVTKNKKQSKLSDIIDYSGVMLYVDEPLNKNKIFSEFEGEFKSLKKIGEHQYKITNKETGQEGEYFYVNGVLNKAIIHHRLLTFELVRV